MLVLGVSVVTYRTMTHRANTFPSAEAISTQLFDRVDSHARVFPVRVSTFTDKPVAHLDAEKVAQAVERIKLHQRIPLSGLLHAAMVFGIDMKVPGPSGSREPRSLRRVIFNHTLSEAYFGRATFIETHYGLHNRVVSPRDSRLLPEQQSHWALLLSELGKHGVSLEQEVTTATGRFSVRDVVRDTVANYTTDAPQIEWMCMSLAMYLPPNTRWVNKFGQGFSFDDMADELLRRRFDSEGLSCHGIHLLEALVVLLRVDQQHPVLSQEQRTKTRDHLARQVTHLVQTQDQDGSWGSGWYRRRPSALPVRAETDTASRVHVTGHHVDWMLLLMPDMLPPDETFQRSAEFLQASLLAASGEEIQSHYCPYSHAAHVLMVLTSPKLARAAIGNREKGCVADILLGERGRQVNPFGGATVGEQVFTSLGSSY